MITGRKACLIASFFGLTASVAHAESWHITERTGTVSVLHQGVSKIAFEGNEVATGDTISTSANGRAVLVRGSDYLIVAPSSRLRVVNPSSPNDLVQIIEDAGSAIFKIKHLDKPHFGVKTPYLAVVVKGTTFSVTVSPAGTAVQVIDGAVEVVSNDGGARSIIKTGMIGQISSQNQYKLHVMGDKSSVIVSPHAPAGAGSEAPNTTSSAAAASPKTTSSKTTSPTTTSQKTISTAPPVAANTITAPIVETGSGNSLAKSTHGLIEGNTSFASSLNKGAKTASSNDAVSSAAKSTTVVSKLITPPATKTAKTSTKLIVPVKTPKVATPVAKPVVATIGNTTGCSAACVITYKLSADGKKLIGNGFTTKPLASSGSTSLPLTVQNVTTHGGSHVGALVTLGLGLQTESQQ